MAKNVDAKGNPICPKCKVKFDSKHHLFQARLITEIRTFPSLELWEMIERDDIKYFCGECNTEFGSNYETAEAIITGNYEMDGE